MLNQETKLMTSKANTIKAQKAALIAACCAIVLALGKLTLFFFTGSLVIALSAWDSTLDVLVSLINRVIVKFARSEADENHPYGHGRAESIAALGQGALITGGAIGIMVSSLQQIYSILNHDLVLNNKASWTQVVFFIFAAFISTFIAKWLSFNGKKLNSPALLADSEHYRVDYITNIASGVAICLVILTQKTILDPIIALFFSLYIIYGAYGLIKTSVNELMDHDIPENVKQSALNLIQVTEPRIIDIHKFRGRKSGHRYLFDFHITLPDSLSFNEVHEITERVEKTLVFEFDGDVTVHADPSNIRVFT